MYSLWVFDDDRTEVIPRCGFDLHFPNNEWFEPPFVYLLPVTCFLWRNVYLGLPLIASNGFPHNQVGFLITHTPCHPHSQPSCGSLLPMTTFPHRFRDEGQPPWPAVPRPSWRGLPRCFISHWCSLIATPQPHWTMYVSDSALCCISRTLPILPSPLSHPSPSPSSPSFHNSYPRFRFSFTCHFYRRSSLVSKSQWPSVRWAPRARVPTSEPRLESESPGFESRVNCFLAVWSWMTCPFRLFPHL